MSIFASLIEALGLEPTPTALRAAETALHPGQAAFLAEMADRFDDLFGPGEFARCAERVATAVEVAEAEDTKARLKAALSPELLWPSNHGSIDPGRGTLLWTPIGGKGEA